MRSFIALGCLLQAPHVAGTFHGPPGPFGHHHEEVAKGPPSGFHTIEHALNHLPHGKDEEKKYPQEDNAVTDFVHTADKFKEAHEFIIDLKAKLDQAKRMRDHAKKVKGVAHKLTGKDKKKHKVKAAVATAGAVVAGSLVGAVGRLGIKTISDQLKLRRATCAIDVTLAGQYVTKAVLQIQELMKVCTGVLADFMTKVGRTEAKYVQSACRANAGGLFGSLAMVAAYLSLSASLCGKIANVPAVCAASIEALFGGFGKAANAAATLGAVCPHVTKNLDQASVAHLGTDIWQNTRRLQEVAPAVGPEPVALVTPKPISPLSEDAFLHKIPQEDSQNTKDLELTTCVLDVSFIASSLVQFSLAFKASIAGCTVNGLTVGPPRVPLLSTMIQDLCVAEIGEMIYAFGTAAQFIAASIQHCGDKLRLQSQCIASAEQLVAVMGGVVFIAAGMDGGCVQLPKLGEPLANVLLPLSALGRRLQMTTSLDNMTKQEQVEFGMHLLNKYDDQAPVSGRDSVYV